MSPLERFRSRLGPGGPAVAVAVPGIGPRVRLAIRVSLESLLCPAVAAEAETKPVVNVARLVAVRVRVIHRGLPVRFCLGLVLLVVAVETRTRPVRAVAVVAAASGRPGQLAGLDRLHPVSAEMASTLFLLGLLQLARETAVITAGAEAEEPQGPRQAVKAEAETAGIPIPFRPLVRLTRVVVGVEPRPTALRQTVARDL